MGGWHFVEPYIEWVLNQIDADYRRPRYAGRPAAAGPPTGLMPKHLVQLKALLKKRWVRPFGRHAGAGCADAKRIRP